MGSYEIFKRVVEIRERKSGGILPERCLRRGEPFRYFGIEYRTHVMFRTGLESHVPEAGRRRRFENVEDVGQHGGVDGGVEFLRFADLDGHPEYVRDVIRDRRELGRRVVEADGVECNELVEDGDGEPGGAGAAGGAVDFPGAACGGWLLEGFG